MALAVKARSAATPERSLALVDADKLVAGITFPPQPDIVIALMRERQRDEPDLRRIATLIGSDPALAAAILKTINSPLYGPMQRITSISHAVALLGMSNVYTLVLGLSLRRAMPRSRIEYVWEQAHSVGLVMSHLARTLGGVKPDDAHLYGLFHDCGMSLLDQRFQDYPETLRDALMNTGVSVTETEELRHGTNHAVMGSLLASNWKLPDHLRLAILWHHDPAIFGSDLPSESLHLIAMGRLAEMLVHEATDMDMDCSWALCGRASLAYLMLDDGDFDEIRVDIREQLQPRAR